MSTPQVNTQAHIATPVTETPVSTQQPAGAPQESDDETFDSADFAADVGTEATDTSTDDGSASFLDEDDEETQDEALVEVHDSKCLNCSHLVSFATKKYKNCHFSKGNEHCPAQSVKITIRIPVEKIVRRFIVAMKTGDNERLGQLYTKLAKHESWYQERITTALKKAKEDEGL
jgi:hypothetical protein